MTFKSSLKPFTLFSCLLVSVFSVLPVTVEAGSIYFSNGRYSDEGRGYNSYQDYDRYRDRRPSNYRRQDRALDFYYGGNRNRGRSVDYDRGYGDEYCPEDSNYEYRGRGRRTYQRPRGFGIFYYGKQR